MEVSDLRLLSRLALEERFQSGLSLGEFLMFDLVTSLLALSFSKFSDYGLPASHGLLKTFQVQEFSFKPIVGLFEGILEGFNLILVLLNEFRAGYWVSYDFLGNIRFRVILDIIIFIFSDSGNNLCVSIIMLLPCLNHPLEVLLVLIHYGYGLLHKQAEINNIVLVLLNIADIVSLIDIEVLSVFFEYLKRSLPLHA